MKFHHLSRHNQFAATQRDPSPLKHQQQQLQQATSQHQRHPHVQLNQQNISDDEDDEYNEVQGFYDNIDAGQNQAMRQQHNPLAMNNGNSASQALDSSGFLMDKNKKLFPQKLWELIHNPSIQHCLRWSQDGQRVYLNRNEFEAYYLKTPNNQFHTQKAISFVRQMNMYGFRKVDDCYYENDNFRRGHQHLLRNMIRRHPNKGLFVGLDHHQLAAAAAAQQALQVNQQFQHFENQKHRAEQALRLNSYLNNHHQYHSSVLPYAAQQHLKHSHSSQFEHMSSQLAQVAASHLTQQQQNQIFQNSLNHSAALALGASNGIMAGGGHSTTSAINSSSNHHHHNNNESSSSNLADESSAPIDKTNQYLKIQPTHQPKKSRLLNNFYASASNVNDVLDVSQANQLIHNQDSMHSTSSVDTQPSQCSSVVNSGSAGSPQPPSPTGLHQRLSALTSRQRRQQTSSSASIRAAALASSKNSALQNQVLEEFISAGNEPQNAATDLSNPSLAARQALHQTLVRSLLQLKHQQPQDFLASLQQPNSRSLLESLASLSSAGTGSIVDLTSNSPTEHTATPPSRSPSPVNDGEAKFISQIQNSESNNTALDLAKSSPNFGQKHASSKLVGGENDLDMEDEVEVANDEGDDGEDDGDERVVSPAESPMDVAKKVKRFLDGQMSRIDLDEFDTRKERSVSPGVRSESGYPVKKRAKSAAINESECLAKSLVFEICDQRGNQMNTAALDEAAQYTKCFLEMLLEDAAAISRSSTTHDPDVKNEIGEGEKDEVKPEDKPEVKQTATGVIDTSSLLLALKSIPSKLLATIHQQADKKQ